MSKSSTLARSSAAAAASSAAAASPPIVSLLSLADHSSHARSSVSLAAPLFSCTPAQLRFASYTPFVSYTATLLLTNKDHVSRRIKVSPPSDHHFRITAISRPGLSAAQAAATLGGADDSGSSKVAPGMGIQYTIEFTPRDRKDYACDLLCSSEREQFLVPIRCTGDRPSLDMPSSLDFGACPVWESTVKPILVRNNGSLPAQFSFSVMRQPGSADSLIDDVDALPPPFTCEPSHGLLAVEESIQVLVTFMPHARGNTKYTLVADLSIDGVSGGSDAAARQAGAASAMMQQQGAGFNATGTFASLSSPLAASSGAGLTTVFDPSFSPTSSPDASAQNVLVSMALEGRGVDVDVHLEAAELVCDPTYVNLKSQKTVLLTNDSDVPIQFEIKHHATRGEERSHRRQCFAKLQDMEAQEREPAQIQQVLMQMKQEEAYAKEHAAAARREARAARRAAAAEDKVDGPAADEEEDASDAESDAVDSDPEESSELELLRAEQYLVRKYQRLYRELDSPSLTGFQHGSFSFDPVVGEIWPRGSKELTVTFAPDAADTFRAQCFVQVSGRDARLPLALTGRGLGAEARFSYTTMDIGNVYMNARHSYEVTLQNIGNIPVSYRLINQDQPGPNGIKVPSRFSFSPASGTLQVTAGHLGGSAVAAGDAGSDDEEAVGSSSSSSSGYTDRVTLSVSFSSACIGDFTETILFSLAGNNTPLKLIYKGRVIGPTFFFEESSLDYGIVSYGFLNSRSLHLHNSSQVAMKVKLRIEEDGRFMRREFGMILLTDQSGGASSAGSDDDSKSSTNLTATSGNVAVVPAHSMAEIQIDLISESAGKVYDDPACPYRLLVDVEGVGEGLIAMPIRATCVVPPLSLAVSSLAYDQVFLRHTYEQLIPLRNDTDLFAKFEVLPQDEQSKAAVTIEPEVYSASVAPHSVYQLKILLTAHRLGPGTQPFYIQIPGSDAIPFVVHTTFVCRGPKVVLDAKTVNFGDVPALTPTLRTLTLHNDSPIPAHFKAFVHRAASCYAVDVPRGILAPFSRLPLQITATLNETLPMLDILHILIHEGDDLSVALKATGSGTTVASTLGSAGMGLVDHGDQFTNQVVSREFRLENRGRRNQILAWEFVPDLPPLHPRGKEAAAAASSSDGPAPPANALDILARIARLKRLGSEAEIAALPQPVFTISPAKAQLEPGMAMVFTMTGVGLRTGLVKERWICKALIGQAKKLDVIYDSEIRANFLNPLLGFSTQSLHFKQVCDPKVPLVVAPPQSLVLTNRTALPLRFKIKVPAPFTASVTEFALEAGTAAETLISFLPDISASSAHARQSTRLKHDLTVIYSDHPQRDRFALSGELNYPNLTFSSQLVDFGTVLNDTSKRVLVTLTNHSTIETTYRWFFSDKNPAAEPAVGGGIMTPTGVKSDVTNRGASRRSGTPNPTLKMGTNAASLPLNECFDILPIRGSLLPGQSEQVELVFYGHQEMRVAGVAVCEVDGGPEYEVVLKGQASSVSYKLERSEIHFGAQELFATASKHVSLVNHGRVAFDFAVAPNPLALPIVDVTPSRGRLKAGERVKLSVHFLSAIPDQVEEVLMLQVAYFDPVPIRLSALGVFPQLFVDLPRADQWMAAQPALAPSESSKRLQAARDPMLIEEVDAAGNVVSSSSAGSVAGSEHDDEEEKSNGPSDDNIAEGEEEDEQEEEEPAEEDDELAAYSDEEIKRAEEKAQLARPLQLPKGGKADKDAYVPLPALMSGPEIDLWQRCLEEAAALLEAKALARRAEEEQMEQQMLAEQQEMADAQAKQEERAQAAADAAAAAPQQRSVPGTPVAASPGHTRTNSGRMLDPAADGSKGPSSVRGSVAPSVAASVRLGLSSARPLGSDRQSMRSRVSTIIPTVSYKPVEPPAALVAVHPEAALHVEADRLFYKYYLLSVLKRAKESQIAAEAATASSRAALPEKIEETKEMDAAASMSLTQTIDPSQTVVPKRESSSLPLARLRTDVSNFSLSRFVADFGHIIKNSVRELSFSITNLGGVFASYTIDKKALHASIFTISPTMVTRVPPGGQTTFTIVCRASNPARARAQKKDMFSNGRETVEVDVPVIVRNGPPLLVRLRANVTVPDVLVSQTKLDFGKVYLQQRREITVQLHNHKAVPAIWNIANAVGSNVRDKEIFEISPNNGTLNPGERINVVIAFTPSLIEGERKSIVRIPLRIASNPTTVQLSAAGQGVASRISFEPAILSLPASLPYSPTPPTAVTITNHSDRAIEVYSLDFDPLYAREEDILRSDESFGVDPLRSDTIFVAPPRNPGDSLPKDMIQRYKLRVKRQKRQEEEYRAKLNAIAGIAPVAPVDPAVNNEVGQLVDGVDGAVALAPSVSTVSLSNGSADLSAELIRNLLVIGSPYAGLSTLARSLASKLEVRPHQVITLDAAVRYFFELTEKDAEEREVLAAREKDYTRDYDKALKRVQASLPKDKKASTTPEELAAMVVAEIGPLKNQSLLMVTDEERALAAQVLSAIQTARAKIAQDAAEAALAAKAAAKKGGAPAAKRAQAPTSPAAAGSKASAAESDAASPSPRGASRSGGKRSSLAAGAFVSAGPSLFQPDAELQEYMLQHTFLDLRGVADVLSESVLSEVLFRFLLVQRGATFKQGVVIDGLECSFVRDGAAAARVIRSAFAQLGENDPATGAPFRDNHLHIAAFEVTRPVAAARMVGARARAQALLDDKAVADALKKFKLLAPKDLDKLVVEAKRLEYERLLELYTRKREAEIMLFQIDHLDPARFDAYWGPDVAEEAAAPAAAAAPASVAAATSPAAAAVVSPNAVVSPAASVEAVAAAPAPISDPLSSVLSALDLPAFPPATSMPEVALPALADPAVLSPEEQAEMDAALRAREEREAAEAAEAKRAEEEEANSKGSRKKKPQKSPASSSAASRATSADGRNKSAVVDAAPAVAPLPTHLQPGAWDEVPVRVSAMQGLPAIPFLKLRRFESVENVPRILGASALPWIEEVFRIEIDPRTLDPAWVPPPVTFQIVRKPVTVAKEVLAQNKALIPGRTHVKTSGFILVDPAIEKAAQAAREAEQAAAEQAKADAAQALLDEEANKKKGGKKLAASSSSAKITSSTNSAAESTVNTARGAGPDVPAVVEESEEKFVAVAEVVPKRVATRWQIPARSSQTVFVSFSSPVVGQFASSLGFEIVGGPPGAEFELPVRAAVAVPEIASDPRSIFMRKVKSSKPGAPVPARAYLQNEKVYEFGPMLVGKDQDTRHMPADAPQAATAPSNGLINNSLASPVSIGNGLTLLPASVKKTNAETWRLTNSGPFPTRIDLSFLYGIDSHNQAAGMAPPTTDAGAKKGGRAAGARSAAASSKDRSPSPGAPTSPNAAASSSSSKDDKKKGSAGSKKAAGGLSEKELKALEKQREQDREEEEKRWAVLRSKPVFIVEPCQFDLGVDESRDITVWAFPQSCATLCDTLVATIKDNPAPVLLPLRCTGAKPSINLSTSELTFERLLLNNSDRRTVDLINTGLLPVAWNLTGLEQMQAVSDVLSIGPVTSGILQPGAPPLTLHVDFKALDERNVHVPLSVECRDIEGFLGVLDTIPLNIRCESYSNKTYLDFGKPQPGGVEFGLLRVGEGSECAFAIVNEGQYEVRYKFEIVNGKLGGKIAPSAFERMVTFIPGGMEGSVAASGKQEIVLQLRPDKELNWSRDCSLKLALFESGSSIPTRRFDIPLSTRVVYSKWHLLPAHGVNFGPVETGALSKKTIKVFNEGPFDFEYRFYPAQREHVYSRANVMVRTEERERAEAGKNAGKKAPASASSSSAASGKKGVAPTLGTRPLGFSTPATTGAGKKPLSSGAIVSPGGSKTSTPLPSARAGDKSDRSKQMAAGAKGATGKKGKNDPNMVLDAPPELEIGMFKLGPVCGTVPAGSSIEVEVSLISDVHDAYLEVLELEITGQDPATLPDGGSSTLNRFELAAESCSPGIDTTDVESIFEEQEVRPNAAKIKQSTAEPKNFFAKEERVFVFAPVIAAPNVGGASAKPAAVAVEASKSSSPEAPSRSIKSSARGKKSVSVEDSRAPEAASALVIQGRTERFRIANPFKVPANVTFNITQSPPGLVLATAAGETKLRRGAAKAAAVAALAAPVAAPSEPSTKRGKGEVVAAPYCAFSVDHSSLIIPPREHRYVSVTFLPEGVHSYSSYFEALVEAGSDLHTRSLQFELRGEGTLPALNVLNPLQRDEETNNIVIDFRRMFFTPGSASANRMSMPVVLRNDGIVPATARFDLLVRATPTAPLVAITSSQTPTAFGFSGRGRMITLAPGASQGLEAVFHPATVGFFSGELRMSIVSNPFESVTFLLRGESYQQDVTLTAPTLETVPLLQPIAPPADEVPDKRASKREALGVAEIPAAIQLVQHLSFPDTAVSEAISQVVTLVNHSDSPYRFVWTPPQQPGQVEPLATKRGGSKTKAAPTEAASSSASAAAPAAEAGGRVSKKAAAEEAARKLAEASQKPVEGSAAAAVLAALAAAGEVDPTLPEFSFSPSVGHIAPHSSKTITITFKSPVCRKYVQALTQCALQRIRYLSPEQAAAKLTAPVSDKKERGSSAERKKRAAIAAVEEKDDGADASAQPAFVPENADWDNSQLLVRWVSEEEARARAEAEAAAKEAAKLAASGASPHSKKPSSATLKGASKGRSKDKSAEEEVQTPADASPRALVQITEVQPEPAYEVVENLAAAAEAAAPTHGKKASKSVSAADSGSESARVRALSASSSPSAVPASSSVVSSLELRLSSVSDVSRFEVQSLPANNTIHFRPTLMYQTRAYTFVVSNPASTRLGYSWDIPAVFGLDEEEEEPFTIEPKRGSIEPHCSESFTVKFSPLDSREYVAQLRATIPDLHSSQQAPVISLRGTSLRPKCHFELANSDYLTAKRRAVNLPGPLGRVGPLDVAATRVIEFKSVGVRVKNLRRFFVLNPTNVSYAFQWKNEDPIESVAASTPRGAGAGAATPRTSHLKSPFKCLTPKGVIESGRKFEMCFEYAPEIESLSESFWRFIIPSTSGDDLEASLEVPLLLVGSVSQPSLELDRTFLNFNALIVGQKHTETLWIHNTENVPFSWALDKHSYQLPSDPTKQVLFVSPTSGVVAPNSKFAIAVTLRPLLEQSYNYNISIVIKRKPSPLTCNIKGEGYALKAIIQCIDGTEEKESPQRRAAREAAEAESKAAAAAAQAAAALAASASPSARGTSAGRASLRKGQVVVPVLPPVAAPVLSPSSALFAPPPPGGESDLSHLGLDMSAAVELIQTLDSDANPLDFGPLSTHERRTKHLIFHNNGKFNLDFAWTLPANKLFTITPMQGQIRKGNKMIVNVCAFSHHEHAIENLVATLSLAGAKKYAVSLSATTRHPLLHFNVQRVDFGPVFIQERVGLVSGSMVPTMFLLRIANHEPVHNIAVDLLWKKTEWLELGTPLLSSSELSNKPPATAGGSTLAQQQFALTLGGSPKMVSASASATAAGASSGGGGAAGSTHSLSNVLAPGAYMELPIVFAPLAKTKYSDTLSFEINNGLYFIDVPIVGEGIPLKLEVEDEGLRVMDFGTVRAGTVVQRATKLVNRSRKAVTFRIAPLRQTASSLSQSLINKSLTIIPAPSGPQDVEGEITLRPRDSVPLNFTFAPSQRMSTFTTEVNLSVLGMQRRLLLLQGGCLGVGLRFDTDKLDFGSIIEQSTLQRAVLLQNVGDVGCKFAFDTTMLGAHYSITPSEGFVPASNNLQITVQFKPLRVGSDPAVFNRHVPCLVDDAVQSGGDGGSGPAGLVLHLSGSCEAAPTEGTELRFDGVVRATNSHTIVVSNDTQSRWVLRPTFRNTFWSGEAELVVPAQSKASYTIQYTPLALTDGTEQKVEAPTKNKRGTVDKKMSVLKVASSSSSAASSSAASKDSSRRPGSSTGSGSASARPRSGAASPILAAAPSPLPQWPRPRVHEGSLFMPLPTGAALTYKLIGTASPAPVEDVVEIVTQAKRIHVINLSIKNWLPTYQRFQVIVDRGNAPDPTTAITGPPTIDVPGLLERKYKLNFYAYREGTTTGTVTFLNESTGESLAYDLRVTAKDSFVDESALAPMSASVRQLVSQHLQISNPLDHEVTFNRFQCSHPAVTVAVPFTIQAKAEGGCDVRFRPLVAHKEQRVVLSLWSDDLGEFQYALALSAAGVGTESRSLRFSTDLGRESAQMFRFTSFASKPQGSLQPSMEYEVRTGGREFSVDAARILVPWADPLGEGVPVVVEVKYEPSALGEVRDMLTIAPVPLGGVAGAAAASSSSSSKDKAIAGMSDPSVYSSLTSGQSSEYTCLLLGSCTPPKPAGPVVVPALGAGVGIRFKNVLVPASASSGAGSAAAAASAAAAESFVYTIDNPAFTLNKRSERVASKSSTVIQVTYKPDSSDASLVGSKDGRRGKSSSTKNRPASPGGLQSPSSHKKKSGAGAADDASGESTPTRPGSSGGQGSQPLSPATAAAASSSASSVSAPPAAAVNATIGKLTITCPAIKNASWVTYLQGGASDK